jgi:glycosyltransferase involved in cell wall biosynthesis
MDLVSRLGLTREVSFKEAMDNVSLARSLATGQTLVMPSHEEVWGLVANEGLACGLHAVVSPFAGVADSIRHMQGVYISTDSSYDSVAKAMVASRSNWKGWIDDPEILRYTPTQFAQTFIHAILNTAEAR